MNPRLGAVLSCLNSVCLVHSPDLFARRRFCPRGSTWFLRRPDHRRGPAPRPPGACPPCVARSPVLRLHVGGVARLTCRQVGGCVRAGPSPSHQCQIRRKPAGKHFGACPAPLPYTACPSWAAGPMGACSSCECICRRISVPSLRLEHAGSPPKCGAFHWTSGTSGMPMGHWKPEVALLLWDLPTAGPSQPHPQVGQVPVGLRRRGGNLVSQVMP